MTKIIDIHTHMLYGIDDGAYDRDMSIALMGRDYEQGVRGIFLTNHSDCMISRHEKYYQRFEKLEKAVKEEYPDLSLYKGCEVLCWQERMPYILQALREGIFPTMNGTDYVLAEFDPGECDSITEMRYCLDTLLDAGYKPIIAHAERYCRIYGDSVDKLPEVKGVAYLQELKEQGCLIQINLFSVEQDSGHKDGGMRKILANSFLEEHLVDMVGTDAHNTEYKSPEAKIGANAIIERYGEEYGTKVLYKNAEKILINGNLPNPGR